MRAQQTLAGKILIEKNLAIPRKQKACERTRHVNRFNAGIKLNKIKKQKYRKRRCQWRSWSTPRGGSRSRTAFRGLGSTTTFFGRRGLGPTARLLPLGVGGRGRMTAAFLLLFFYFFWFDRLLNESSGDWYWRVKTSTSSLLRESLATSNCCVFDQKLASQ